MGIYWDLKSGENTLMATTMFIAVIPIAVHTLRWIAAKGQQPYGSLKLWLSSVVVVFMAVYLLSLLLFNLTQASVVTVDENGLLADSRVYTPWEIDRPEGIRCGIYVTNRSDRGFIYFRHKGENDRCRTDTLTIAPGSTVRVATWPGDAPKQFYSRWGWNTGRYETTDIRYILMDRSLYDLTRSVYMGRKKLEFKDDHTYYVNRYFMIHRKLPDRPPTAAIYIADGFPEEAADTLARILEPHFERVETIRTDIAGNESGKLMSEPLLVRLEAASSPSYGLTILLMEADIKDYDQWSPVTATMRQNPEGRRFCLISSENQYRRGNFSGPSFAANVAGFLGIRPK